eukprot:3608838-Prymnesium_polylepis.1
MSIADIVCVLRSAPRQGREAFVPSLRKDRCVGSHVLPRIRAPLRRQPCVASYPCAPQVWTADC